MVKFKHSKLFACIFLTEISNQILQFSCNHYYMMGQKPDHFVIFEKNNEILSENSAQKKPIKF